MPLTRNESTVVLCDFLRPQGMAPNSLIVTTGHPNRPAALVSKRDARTRIF